MPGYFLIVWDFIRFSREQCIPVGPGRGSAAGSLVAYSLHITDIDPLQNELLFERFLNPERVSFPDIDIDFCMRRRGEVIDYVTDKYGRENVSQIITFGTMGAKAVIRDAARALDMPYAEADRIAKLIPNTLNITLDEALKQSRGTGAAPEKRRTRGRPVANRLAPGRLRSPRLDARGGRGDFARSRCRKSFRSTRATRMKSPPSTPWTISRKSAC